MTYKFRFSALLLISVLLCSCGTFRINNTSDFQKTEDLSILNGEYFSNSEITKKAEYPTNILSKFNIYKEQTDFVNLTFEEPDQVALSYFLTTEDGVMEKKETFKGKRSSCKSTFQKNSFLFLLYMECLMLNE